MKKYVAYLIFAFAVMFILPSCENGKDVDFDDNTLTLTLSCNNLGLTRATIDGEDALNENTVTSIDCFFYPADADFDTEAILVKSNITALTKTTLGTYTATIKFEETELTSLFGPVSKGGSANCLIYVIANRPTNVALPTGNPTINQLKALTITSDFSKPQAQQLFVMDSDATPDSDNDTDIDNDDLVIYSVDANGSKSLTATVPLYRTAAKITLSVNRFGPENGGNKVTVDGKTYTPNYGGVYAVLHNGINKSVIAPDVVSRSVASSDFFATKNFSMVAQSAPCKLSVPFYSYASDWSESTENAAYITLVVPWQAEGETSYEPYYYKVPVNYSGDKLERNTHYKIDIAVSILGTLNPDKTVEILPSYTILDWSNDEIETAMSDFRYLMVEKNHYVMNNVNTIEIPYWTSHNCTIINVSVKRPDLSANTVTEETISSSEYTLDLTTKDGNAYITYTKELDNNYESENFDFVPYTIKFRLQHTTESAKYYEDIEIIQYPAIYGQAQVNLDYSNGGGSNDSRYTMVNGYYGTSSSTSSHTNLNNQDFFASCTGLYSGFSPNMYVFTVTSVQGTDYVIGDPRTNEIDTDLINAKRVYRSAGGNNGDAWVTAKALYDGASNRKLKYYYPTEVDYTSAATMQNSRTENMIAPKFRLASGYAVLYMDAAASKDIEGMKKRCASYQEDGYPAGRWRLPTKAEFEFIFSLVNKEKLPQIYELKHPYWCAHGVGNTQNDGTVSVTYQKTYDNNGNGLSVRCVYDDWYWGSERALTTDAEKKVFTWGDVPRSQKAYAPSINY